MQTQVSVKAFLHMSLYTSHFTHIMQPCEKLSAPCDSAALRSTFSSNNIKQSFSGRLPVFHVTMSEFWRTYFYNLNSLRFAYFCFPQSLSGPGTAFRCGSGLDFGWTTLILSVFCHSVADLLLCMGSLSCCVNHFLPSFSW